MSTIRRRDFKSVNKKAIFHPISLKPQPLYSLHLKSEREGVIDDKKVNPIVIENGDFEVEAGWLLVGRTAITELSATKGRKVEDNEIVHFAFLNFDSRVRSNSWISSRAAIAASGIVRFSTKRSGEIGRFPMEWSKCLIPLVNSKKGRALGRCLAAPLRKEFTEKNLPPPPSKKPVKIKSMKVLAFEPPVDMSQDDENCEHLDDGSSGDDHWR
ncbi:hypothetical protein L2E82_08482 [Cichorium intybus]|uniref:Uncharacterized protein n=1 Tax=Cichorium intybus TaxID=13427 RepID=A0ACB9G6J9_CICIN|nr:hypothetical protein L2E82_08482 [Cichorium intybus]